MVASRRSSFGLTPARFDRNLCIPHLWSVATRQSSVPAVPRERKPCEGPNIPRASSDFRHHARQESSLFPNLTLRFFFAPSAASVISWSSSRTRAFARHNPTPISWQLPTRRRPYPVSRSLPLDLYAYMRRRPNATNE
ncbi:hypothetical protein K523DRAFT_102269 [Schizophyllum commune Tattone D]|nr:hypothetical protein K523DRAFT_102269 [Schizophyllum commune Tattone D]